MNFRTWVFLIISVLSAVAGNVSAMGTASTQEDVTRDAARQSVTQRLTSEADLRARNKELTANRDKAILALKAAKRRELEAAQEAIQPPAVSFTHLVGMILMVAIPAILLSALAALTRYALWCRECELKAMKRRNIFLKPSKAKAKPKWRLANILDLLKNDDSDDAIDSDPNKAVALELGAPGDFLSQFDMLKAIAAEDFAAAAAVALESPTPVPVLSCSYQKLTEEMLELSHSTAKPAVPKRVEFKAPPRKKETEMYSVCEKKVDVTATLELPLHSASKAS